jgi:hypothetical protein
MAQLKDLLSSVPAIVEQELQVYQHQQKLRKEARREAIAYQHRLDRLSGDRRVFNECQQTRPSKRKVQNRFSKEEAGTKGRITMGVRTGKYGVVVCSCVNKW